MSNKLICPFCGEELEDAGIHSRELYFWCTNCYMKQKEKDDNYTASPRIWQALIQSRQQLKMLEPIVAELQGRADINAEVARDSYDLVAQWYEKYEQSKRDLQMAVQALKATYAKGFTKSEAVGILQRNNMTISKAIDQIEHKE